MPEDHRVALMLRYGTHRRTSYVIRATIYIVVGVCFSFTEYLWQARRTDPCGSNALLNESALTTRAFYTQLTAFDWRKPQNLNVTVVTLRQDRDLKERFELCNKRGVLAE